MDENVFAVVCFLILMDHHGEGYIEAHPNYIKEKLAMLSEGFDAMGRLDPQNQNKVLDYLTRWEISTPSEIKTT